MSYERAATSHCKELYLEVGKQVPRIRGIVALVSLDCEHAEVLPRGNEWNEMRMK